MVYESPWEHTGDGAVHATVEDLVKWGENLTTGTVGGKELVKRMSEIGPEISPTGETIIDNEDYAFGLRLAEGFNCRYLNIQVAGQVIVHTSCGFQKNI